MAALLVPGDKGDRQYAQGPVNTAGFDPVMSAFNSKMATLSKGGDAKAMLAELQKNGEAALKGN